MKLKYQAKGVLPNEEDFCTYFDKSKSMLVLRDTWIYFKCPKQENRPYMLFSVLYKKKGDLQVRHLYANRPASNDYHMKFVNPNWEACLLQYLLLRRSWDWNQDWKRRWIQKEKGAIFQKWWWDAGPSLLLQDLLPLRYHR